MTRVKHGWSSFVLVLVLVFLVICSTPAQNATGTILGVVRDSSGAAVPNANVTAVRTDTGQSRTATTGPDGSFRFPQLQTGGYTVRVTASGFETAERKGVTLEVAQEAALDFDLQVGSMSQTVSVTEAAPLVDTTSSQIGNEVNEQKITDLPLNGRNWTDLTLLQPGITQSQLVPSGTLGPVGTGGLMFSSGGATLWSNMFMIDGANMINGQGVNNSSIIGTSLGVDGVKEYKTITSLFSAEYGLVMGSQTTIVSKGGSNSFHGDVFEYIRNSGLDARNHFDALDTLNDNGFGANKSLPYPGKRIPPFQRNNFGGAFGGPIQKDKTFFWLTFEGLRQHLGQTIATTTIPKACFVDQSNVLQTKIPAQINVNVATNPFTVPASAGTPAVACVTDNASTPGHIATVVPSVLGLADLFPQPNVVGYATLNYTFPYIAAARENYGQARLDHTFSEKDFAFARYTHDESDLLTSAVSAGLSSAAYKGNLTALHSGSQFVTLSETHIFSTSLLNTARFSYSRTTGVTDPFTSPSLIGTPLAEVVGQDFGSVAPGSGVTSYGLGSHAHFFQNNYQVGDDANWSKGKHSLKFGTLIQRYAPFHEELAVNTRGSASFNNLANFFSANYSSINVGIGSEVRFFSWSTAGFYVQDDYRVLPRFTLNLGLRYEFETVPKLDPSVSFALRNPLTDTGGTPGPVWVNPSLRDFSPRLGFAWDVTGRGTTSVRGGAGIYYDVGNHGSALVQLAEGTPPINTTFQVNKTAAACGTTGTLPPCFALPLPIATNTAPSEKSVQYQLQQAHMYQFNLSVNQQLPWSMGLTASYVGSRGNNLMQITEGNPTVPVGIGPNRLPYYCAAGGVGTAVPSAATPCLATATFPGRVNPAFGQVFLLSGGGDSWYNSLQLAVSKRITRGLQFQASYTWSKLLDDGETQLSPINGQVIQAPGENWDDKGPGAFDAASNARINILYHVPAFNANRYVSTFANGWWFGTILAAQSGYPITPVLGGADRALQNNTMISDRPNLDPSFNKDSAVTGNPNAWFNLGMFDVTPAGTLGNEPRGGLRGPGLLNLDFSANKDFKFAKLGEQGLIEFRAETFNILNHTNYANPNATVWNAPSTGVAGTPAGGQINSGSGLAANSTAGQISGTTTNSRQIQFALKVVF